MYKRQSYTDSTVAPSTTYSYTVSAFNGSGQASAQSAPLSVTTPASSTPCTASWLISAIAAANTAGGGTVALGSGCVYTLTAVNNTADGPTGLPQITRNITIQGNGSTITRSTASGTPAFRILDVASGATVTVTGVTMSNGIANDGSHGGGALYNHGNLTITSSTFSGNSNPATSGSSGGAIQNSGTLTVTGCVFTGNTAMEGGGVFNQNLATIQQSTFTSNTATIYGGGALLNAYGTMTVVGSTFVLNTGPGGGVLDNDTTTNISDSTMYNNTGGTHGGGAIQNFGVVNLTTSTVAGDTSPYGADIYTYTGNTTTVSSTIVANGLSGSNCGGPGTLVDGGYNLDTAASCGFSAANHSLSNANPMLQALASNGGPTQTMALSPGSAALDVIPSATAGCGGTTDQRGISRPQGPGCEIGAYELIHNPNDTQPPTTPTGLVATDSDPGAVALSWNVSTDNVAVAGYTVVPQRRDPRQHRRQHHQLHRQHRGGADDLHLCRGGLRPRRQLLGAVPADHRHHHQRAPARAALRTGCLHGDRLHGHQPDHPAGCPGRCG